MQQFVPVAGDERGPVGKPGAAGGQRPADVGEGRVLVGQQVRAEPGGLLAQGVLGTAGQHERQRGRADEGFVGGRCVRRRGGGGLRTRVVALFEDDVRVGAADAEGGHCGAAGPAGHRPRHGFLEQRHRAGRPVDVGGGLVQVEAARRRSVPHRHDHLDDPGDARGCLGVADVGLDGAEQQRPVGRAVLAVGGEDGLGLDGVAELGAGAVRLDDVDVRGAEPRVDQGLADDALLGGAVGRGEAVARTVLVDRRAPEHREHRVAVGAGVGEALDEQHTDALAPAGAVGGVGEGTAAPVRGEAALPAEPGEAGRGGHDHDAAGQCQ